MKAAALCNVKIAKHLRFAGTPNIVQGLAAVFSALEVVPLVLAAFEA
jgi:nitric oxide reductase large subunit